MGVVCHRCGYLSRPGEDTDGICLVDGSVLVEEAEHARDPNDGFLGKTLGGKYRIVGILGNGGMGAMYRAIQTPVGREVAFKVLRGFSGPLAEVMRARFLREAAAIGKLDHPGVVRLFDFWVDPDGTRYMVLELVRGRTLRAAMESGELNRRRFLEIMDRVMAAVGAAHGVGLVHRDLKPENVMLARTTYGEEAVKVLDFGIAKILEATGVAASRLTDTGTVFGTPQYMSPEQVTGKAIDHRIDIYSLGVMLYEGLVGMAPHGGPTPFSILQQHVTEPVPELPRDVPASLAEVVRRSMAKEPGERFQSVAEMREALRAAIEGYVGESCDRCAAGYLGYPDCVLDPCGDMSGLQAGAPWPMRGRCPTHVARSPYVGAQTPRKKWDFPTQGPVFSSPAVGADGTVYVGSLDGKLYAIGLDGRDSWHFVTG